MSAATIVFLDIVGFSKNPNDQQRTLVDSLTTEVLYGLRSLMNPPMDTPQVVAMPTGDGMALAFLHKPSQTWSISTIMNLINRVQVWAKATDNSVSLRFGVHCGEVEFITDINYKLNICGDTINYAQRVMDAANPGQVLFSDVAFRQCIGAKTSCYIGPPFSVDTKAVFQGPLDVHAKHGVRMLVYKMTLDPPSETFSNEDPVSKDLMTVGLTPLPKEIVGSFGDRVRSAQEMGLIQLTGDRLLNEISIGNVKFSDELRRLLVFMPNPRVYQSMNLRKPFPLMEYVEECAEKWKELLTSLKQRYPNAVLKLGLFEEPPYLGASFLDWEKQGGRIHVSPYIWGTPTMNCPGYEIEWVAENPSTVYQAYVRGLSHLDLNTANAAFA